MLEGEDEIIVNEIVAVEDEIFFFYRQSISSTEVIHKAEKAFQEYMAAVHPAPASQAVPSPSSPSSQSTLLRWTPPPMGFIKINADASFQVSSKTGGIGFVGLGIRREIHFLLCLNFLSSHRLFWVKLRECVIALTWHSGMVFCT
ncbi:hypothetical protein NE237_012868 [Protea cynaroides]|uniref:RNase H type-1 domain-containing protein n=1 Tax=Protea cynaroides TaxID=273540 RepID=A0A9Q0GYV8_9MAGN|nr:hypothetical protein NE237_012868 [Protea cynaroides]